MDNKLISDLKQDIEQSVDSAYAEYNNPSRNLIIENIKGVFISSDDYDFPELKEQITKAIKFQYTKNNTPEQEVLNTMIESVFMSWNYKR